MSNIAIYSAMLEDAGLQVQRAVKVPSGSEVTEVYRYSVVGRGGLKASVEFIVNHDELSKVDGLPPMYLFEEGQIFLKDTVPTQSEEELNNSPRRTVVAKNSAKSLSIAVLHDKLKEASETVDKAFDLGTAKLYMGKEKPRRYLGASHVGNPCIAYNSLCVRGFIYSLGCFFYLAVTFGADNQLLTQYIVLAHENAKAQEIGRNNLYTLLLRAHHPTPRRPGGISSLWGLKVGINVVEENGYSRVKSYFDANEMAPQAQTVPELVAPFRLHRSSSKIAPGDDGILL